MSSATNGARVAVELPDPQTLTALTVRNVLAMPVMRRGLPQVLAGGEELDRTIRWVHAGEVSNIASLLVGGEMLLTTGMGIGTRAWEQRGFVDRLAAKRIAALVIELGTTFERPPEALVTEAAKHRLPLIALSREIPFVAVTEAVHTEIVSSHYALMRRGDDIRSALYDLVFEGQGIPGVVGALAAQLGGPVFLAGADDRLLVHAKPPGYDLEPLDMWEGVAEGRRSESAFSVPVRGGHHGDGRLILVDIPLSMAPLASIALNHAADLIALVLLRQRQEQELLLNKQGRFLSDLADLRITPRMVKRAAKAAGLEGDSLVPIVAHFRAPLNWGVVEWTPLLHQIQRRLDAAGVRALIGRRDATPRILALLTLRAGEDRRASADAIAGVIRSAVDAVSGADAVDIVVGRTSDPETCAAELRLTERGAGGATVLPDRSWHDSASLELRGLLWTWRHDDDLSAFVERVLGPIVEYDSHRKLVLMPTLEALLEHNGHKADTARALHLNRQALYKRLTRIEELLGVGLSNADTLLTLHVALQARQYLGLE